MNDRYKSCYGCYDYFKCQIDSVINTATCLKEQIKDKRVQWNFPNYWPDKKEGDE